ncbi:flippase [Erwinia sp. S43]|uniref:flippase n=1 Tax=unclassified Erwinia TaxID=2622719 RepID=UPI00190BCB3D|nr:flippase [Erwinia sp. INIA01]MBK0033532.1 flippase [Erwinia sp. S43]MCW1874152.1 flippase [Erwinia sp. INIA01]
MSLIKNTIWNLSGYAVPTLVAIPALGFLARDLGPERFGLFSLALAIIGYASIFDAGLTRAIVREISLFRDDNIECGKIVANSSLILTVLGITGGAIIYFSGPAIVNVLNVKSGYYAETLQAISLVSLSLPFFLLNQAWLSILEGREEFKKSNLIKSVNSSLIAGLPALAAMIHSSLTWAVLGLLAARVLSLLITFYRCREHIVSGRFTIETATMARLMRYGGWITVSNIISPLMSYFDRFIVSHVMGASHVAFYTAPAEGVQRLTILPGALARAVFPKLSGRYGLDEKKKQRNLAYSLMLLTIVPVAVVGIIFSEFIITTWLGPAYAGLPAEVFKILLVGFVLGSVAQIPFASIQGAGFSKVTAMIHLCELLPYLAILYYFINLWGVIGVACAWTLRVSVDCLALILINNKLVK